MQDIAEFIAGLLALLGVAAYAGILAAVAVLSYKAAVGLFI